MKVDYFLLAVDYLVEKYALMVEIDCERKYYDIAITYEEELCLNIFHQVFTSKKSK
jgi:hypothetical protein